MAVFQRRASPQTRAGRASAAGLVSLTAPVVGLALVIAASHRAKMPAPPQLVDYQRVLPAIVWLPQAGNGEQPHGGGGSGDHMPSPPGKIELPGHDALTVPAGKRPAAPVHAPAATPPEVAPPIAQLDLPALATFSGAVVHPGSMDGVPASASLGPGVGGSAGSGNGSGDGPGRGPGRGPGSGGNQGGGPVKQGSAGLADPTVVREVRPLYTAEAMRARVQGTAVVECIVLPDGTVGEAQVVRSLDPTFGLDREALTAARKWLFQPGRVNGQAVAVLVRIELAFALR